MSSIDMNELLLNKTVDTFSDEDKEAIIENRDQLNAEEETKFKDFLPAKEVEAQAQPEEKTEEESASPAISKQQLDSYLEEKRKEWKDQGATQSQVKEAEKKVREYFKDGELPKDWNDAFGRFHASLQEDFKSEKEKWKAELKEELRKEAEAKEIEREQEKINKKLDTQYNDLFKEGKVPDPKTPEGQTFDKVLATIAMQFNLDNYKDAYDKYLTLNGAQVTPQAKVNPNKKAASMVGSGVGVPAKGGNKPSYNSIRSAKSITSLALEGL